MPRTLRSLGRWPRLIPLLAIAALAIVAVALAQPRHSGPFHAPTVGAPVGDSALAASKPVVLTAQDRALLARKQRLASEYALVQQGKMSAAQFQRDWTAFISHDAPGKSAPATLSHVSLCPLADTACWGRPHTLSLPQESQITNYYCGPAAVEEAMLALHATTGPRGEDLLASPFPATGQHILAGDAYLATDLNGGTNWGSGVVPATLNAWEHAHYYVAVNGPGMGGSFSLATFEQDIMLDVAAGHPIIVGLRMDSTPSRPHLIGYPPNQTHYHWIAILGYADRGAVTVYADSVHDDTQFWPWAGNVPAYGAVSTSAVMYPLVETFGYVW